MLNFSYVFLQNEHFSRNYTFTNYKKVMIKTFSCQIVVQFSRSIVSDSVTPWTAAHQASLGPSSTPVAYSNSCPSHQWSHPTISSSVVPFSSCFQSFPASGSFAMSQFFMRIDNRWFSLVCTEDLWSNGSVPYTHFTPQWKSWNLDCSITLYIIPAFSSCWQQW